MFDAGREQYMARLLDRILADPLASEHNYYFDVATAHLYFQPDQIYDLLGVFQEIMRERALSRPIWLVETNAPPFDDPDWPVADPALAVSSTEQAAYMPQALAAALAAGAERVGVYKLRDTEGDRAANPEPFGLLRLDGSRRVAFTTLREAVRLMRGTTSATRERWDEVGQFRLDQPDRFTTVLFGRLPDPQQVSVTAVAPTARLVDMWGQEQIIEAQGGRFLIDLQQALCTQTIGDYCMIGGTVYYLIQALDGSFPPQEAVPLLPPTVTPTLLPPVTWTPQPTVTPEPSATAASSERPTPAGTNTPPSAAISVAVTAASVATHAAGQPQPTIASQTAIAKSPPDQEAPGDDANPRLPVLLLGSGLLILLFALVIWQRGRRPGDN